MLPTGGAGQTICEVCPGGSVEKAFPQTWVGNQDSRRAVTGLSLGVERWLSVSNKAEQLFFWRSRTPPFPEGSPKAPPPMTLASTEADEAPPQRLHAKKMVCFWSRLPWKTSDGQQTGKG